ncbi:hypothetical protein LCGC14_2796360 [marine sediment metagenome]|uniref:Uncharacterized protein n=1 Tax=marine sediment metagenome TaxID=412755 RepID=A0A0F8ZB27_9ZZZZ
MFSHILIGIGIGIVISFLLTFWWKNRKGQKRISLPDPDSIVRRKEQKLVEAIRRRKEDLSGMTSQQLLDEFKEIMEEDE